MYTEQTMSDKGDEPQLEQTQDTQELPEATEEQPEEQQEATEPEAEAPEPATEAAAEDNEVKADDDVADDTAQEAGEPAAESEEPPTEGVQEDAAGEEQQEEGTPAPPTPIDPEAPPAEPKEGEEEREEQVEAAEGDEVVQTEQTAEEAAGQSAAEPSHAEDGQQVDEVTAEPADEARDETQVDEPSQEEAEGAAGTDAVPEEAAAEAGAEGDAAAEAADETPAEPAAEEPQAEQAEETPAEPASEDAPVEQAEEEAPAEQATEEAPADPASEEAPAEQATEEAPAEQASEEAPAEQDAEAVDEAKPADQATETAEPATADAATERTDQVPEVDPHGVTPRSQFPPDAIATVKFMLMPSGQMVTLAYNLGQTIVQCKEHFATEFKIPVTNIIILLEGKAQEDASSLGDLGVQPNGTIQLEVQSSDPANVPLGEYRSRDDYHMPDVISVRVQLENGDYKDVVVEISRHNRKKPFLGGYKHKKTGIEYHHASAQTVAKPPPPPLGERNCRETQTTEQRQQLQQTSNDTSTQMTGIGVYVSNITDKLVVPGKYTTADERQVMLTKKVITLQKYFRRWYAIRYVTQVREDRDRRLEWEQEEEERKKQEKEQRIKREFQRRMNPKTKEDFDLLYHALEKWRLEELELINSTLSGAERKAALCQLLEQETQLIASIGRNKLDADNQNRHKKIQKFLGKAAAPKKWKGRDGKYTEMDTPYTIRARELMDIYNSVTMKYLTQDERLDVLLTLKHTVKEHDCKLTQEIIDLIDREADLLMRGVKEENLDGLRQRIATLFLQYIKTPTFNPEITKYLKVPQDPASLRKNIYFCSSCNHYLPSTEFHLASNERTMGKCRRCTKVDNDARVRQDYSYYRQMLANLRQAEEKFSDNSKIAFLMQEGDLRYLVENIWNCQSMLSAWDDLYDLELVRWDVRDEWSPWNTILLTREEAAAHAKLENLDEGYGKVFIHKAQHKHTLARNYFSRMPGMAELMREKDNEQASRVPSVSGKRVSVQASA